ncbi:MAG: ABC transporter substrate-binding protein [Candidatus Omnitrophota bacterium]
MGFINKLKVIVLCIFGFSAYINNVYASDVVVILGQDLKVFQRTKEGLQKACKYKITEFSLYSNTDKIDEFVDKIKTVNPKVIGAIGPKAAQIAKLHFPNIPVVFALVTNPLQYDLDDVNISGVSLDVAPEDQFSYLKKIMPQTKKVGVIYNPERNKNVLDEANSVCGNFNLELLPKAVKDIKGVPDAISFFEKEKIDAFWMITDSVVANSAVFERLLLFSFSNKIPLICPAAVFVKKGGFFSVSVSYTSLGIQMAEIINNIVAGKTTPEESGIQWPSDITLTINMNTANKIGIVIPESVKNQAKLILQ